MKTVKVALDDDYEFTAEVVTGIKGPEWDDVVYVDVEDDSEEVYVIVSRHIDEDDSQRFILESAYDDEADAHDLAIDIKDGVVNNVLVQVYVETVRIS